MASPSSRLSFASTDNAKQKGKQEEAPDHKKVEDPRADKRGPGPAAYTLPTTVGKSGHDPTKVKGPSYSMSPRLSGNQNPEGPGPAGYSPHHPVRLTNKGPDPGPAFSMAGRDKNSSTFDKLNTVVSPGPIYQTDGTHSPRFKKAPSYTMGARLDKGNRDPSPGPNSYTLPTTLGSKKSDQIPHVRGAPAAGMHGRIDINSFAYDHVKGPGPARFGTFDPSLTRRRPPAFSIQGRTAGVPSKTVTPGPGAYSPENVYNHMKSSPRFSIGVRHGEAALPFMTLADITD